MFIAAAGLIITAVAGVQVAPCTSQAPGTFTTEPRCPSPDAGTAGTKWPPGFRSAPSGTLCVMPGKCLESHLCQKAMTCVPGPS
jgi:hypothetical protein